MKVMEFLAQHESEIACTKCGKCCPDTCEAKKDNLCTIHPSITGISDSPENWVSGRTQRIPSCWLSPVNLVVKVSAACPPVLDVIQKLTSERPAIIQLSGRYKGVEVIADFSPLGRSPMLQELLQRKIR